MSRPVKKAIFPVAGLGTRSLPATKATPKEMLCVVDKPVIQYAVEEARAAGIEQFIFVTSRGKSSLEDHFDRHFELYETLSRRGKTEQLAEAEGAELPAGSYCFVRQPEALGLGHAVWCARHMVGDEPFAVLLPDEIFKAETPLLKQLVGVHERQGGSVLAVREVPPELTARYGILDVAEDDGRVATVRGLVEKPAPAEAPSTLSIVGRYILQPEIFGHLDRQERGAGNEIQLTDAIAALIGEQSVYGARFDGDRYDCGDKAGFILANLAYGLARRDIAAGLGPRAAALLDESLSR